MTRDPRRFQIALALFVGAFLFRLIGIGWGLPNELRHFSLHPDEPVVFAYSQQIEPAKGDFDPGFYNYGTLYLTMMRVASDAVAAYGGGPSPNDPESIYAYVARCHLAGRLLNTLACSFMAALTFLMLRRWMSEFGAIFGALFIALAPGLVVHSRFQTVDVMATALLAASAYFALRLIPKGGEDIARPRDVWLAGMFAGLSAGVKYTGVLGLLTIWAALAIGRKPGWVTNGLKSTAACVAAFLLSTPGIVLNTAKFLEGFQYELRHAKEGHGLVFEGTSPAWIYHISNLMTGTGPLLLLVGLVGLVAAVRFKRHWAIALIAFALPYYLLIGTNEVKFLRYTFPLYLCLAAGYGWAMAVAHRRQGKYLLIGILGFIGMMGLDPGGMRMSAVQTGFMATADARDRAAMYLKSVGEGKQVGLVSDPWFYTPPLFPDVGMMRAPWEQYAAKMAQRRDPMVVRYVPENPNERFDWDVRLLTEIKPDFVVFSSFELDDVLRLSGFASLEPRLQIHVDRARSFLEQLSQDYEPATNGVFGASTTSVHDMMYIQPVVQVWKRKG